MNDCGDPLCGWAGTSKGDHYRYHLALAARLGLMLGRKASTWAVVALVVLVLAIVIQLVTH